LLRPAVAEPVGFGDAIGVEIPGWFFLMAAVAVR
jgi:hypothetical protein